MQKFENLVKYQAYFHDGTLFGVKRIDNTMEFLMSSAEMDPEDIQDNILLAKDDCLKGKLHVEDVVSVKISNEKIIENLFNTYDYGTILDFEVGVGVVEFGILWTNFPPKTRTSDFSVINIKAKKIWWENTPDFKDPFVNRG